MIEADLPAIESLPYSRQSVAPRLLVPAAAGLAIALFAHFQVDRAEAPETALLGWLSFVALAALAAMPKATGPLRIAALATVTVILTLPAGPARGVAITGLLAVAVAAGLLAATRQRRTGLPQTGTWIPAAVALQALAHPRLLPPAMDGGTALLALVVDWLLVPAACGAVAASLASRQGREIASIAAGTVVVAGGGWTWTGAAVLAFLAGLGHLPARRVPKGRTLSVVAGLSLAAVTVTVTAAGYPWLSPDPARTALAAVATLPHRTTPVVREPVVVDASPGGWRLSLEPREARAVLFDTYLTGAGDLTAGTPVAMLGVGLAGGETLSRELRVDRPRLYHLAGDGRTFVGRSRNRIEIPSGSRVTELTLQPAGHAPDGHRIVLWWAGCER